MARPSRHRRRRGGQAPPGIDRSFAGNRARERRLAATPRELLPEELAALGHDAESIAARRRRRPSQWIDTGFEQLDEAGLIKQYVTWDPERYDSQFELLIADRELGRAVLAALYGPATFRRLDPLWDGLHEFAGGRRRIWLNAFMREYFAGARRVDR